MIPFFFLKVRKGNDYFVFNPVDNIEYIVNHTAYRILELCDGSHTLDEISARAERDFSLERLDAMDYVASFLDEMYRAGMIVWRREKIDYEDDFPPPSNVFWNVTGECNLQCAHCYNFNNRKQGAEFKTGEIKHTLEEIAGFGVKNISFSGGEPLVRKDFLEIVSYAAGLGFNSVALATNGTLMDRKTAKKLREANINVQVSIDGDTADVHDAARGVKGAFDGAIRAIKLLQEESVEVSVSTTITTLNVERMPGIIQLIHDLDVKNYRTLGVVPIGRGKNNIEKLKVAPGRMKSLAQYLKNRKIPLAGYTFAFNPPPAYAVDFCASGACSAARDSCSITAQGNVVPCSYFWDMNGENLRDHSFQWIWENSTILNYFRTIRLNDIKGVCRECNWLSVCRGGCKAENYSYGDIFGSNQVCWVADEIRQGKNMVKAN